MHEVSFYIHQATDEFQVHHAQVAVRVKDEFCMGIVIKSTALY